MKDWLIIKRNDFFLWRRRMLCRVNWPGHAWCWNDKHGKNIVIREVR